MGLTDEELIERMLPRVITRDGFEFHYERSTCENKLYDDGVNPPTLWLYFYVGYWVAQVGGLRLVLTANGEADTVKGAQEAAREKLIAQGFIITDVTELGSVPPEALDEAE